MIVIGIVIIVVATGVFVASSFMNEKLSQKDLERIESLNEVDLKAISERQVKDVRSQLENSIEEMVDESLEIIMHGLDKEATKKMMAIGEYSETAVEEVHKAHDEVMFLYTMLNDKQSEVAEAIADLQKLIKQANEIKEKEAEVVAEAKKEKITKSATISKTRTKKKVEEPVVEEVKLETKEETESTRTQRQKILKLYKEGKNEVEIAKTLECGIGMVRLVVGVYKNEA